MGSSVSTATCRNLNCTSVAGESWGGLKKGEIAPDPDIAGIGIISVFIAVTCTALLAGFIDVIWQIIKVMLKNQHRVPSSSRPSSSSSNTPRRIGPSASEILEAIVISCADQQLFTGGAYAIAVRYFKGCSVTAYHYNILANGLLISCATHLVAASISTRYWKYPLMGLLRATLTGLVFLVTGLLLTKANEGAAHTSSRTFPVAVPTDTRESNDRGSEHFLPAACFMETLGANQLTEAVKSSLVNPNRVLIGPNQAWSLYLLMLIWWSVAVLAEFVRFMARGLKKDKGARRAVLGRVSSWASGGKKVADGGVAKEGAVKKFFRRFGHFLHMVYLVCAVAIGTLVVAFASNYIRVLRAWVDGSGWLDLNQDGENPEDDAKSFGQLVPIFMSALTVFAFLQMLSEKFGESRRRARRDMESGSREKGDGAMISYLDNPRGRSPSSSRGGGSKRSKSVPLLVEETPVIPTPGSEYSAWLPSPATPSRSFSGTQPLLGIAAPGSRSPPNAGLSPSPSKISGASGMGSFGKHLSSARTGGTGFHAM